MDIEGRKITIHAADLDGFLRDSDKQKIDGANELYENSLQACQRIENAESEADKESAKADLVESARQIGRYLRSVVALEERIHVYCYETPQEQHGGASRLIAKLRDPNTGHEEFLYYIQRAYELLFAHVFADASLSQKRSIITQTPVTNPCRNYGVHRIPNVDSITKDAVMCVMLRGALLPSMIISKEIQDYSSDNFITPFALFKIKRDETKKENNMA